MITLDIIGVLIIIVTVTAIIGYATYLLFKEIRSGRPKITSVKAWLRNVFEALWGI